MAELLVLAEQADEANLPAGMGIAAEIAFCQERLLNLQQSESLLVIEGRAVALELGQPFARLGTKVMLLSPAKQGSLLS